MEALDKRIEERQNLVRQMKERLGVEVHSIEERKDASQ
ncbi:hypothetical protein MAXJ12_36171 [Mesorhizobium alhagi CCNWXJ12-2]|uniref:Uncharacterized protein n=1 Tax=Mesorhizobium alhagi CCNWXJ12-2 TaxID=1107882 RepID=H0I415_9HYPH|nr:hypothetical protein MAXJ12_36171 [Mesorhizobium alhagi CCNWXJ12-2]